MKKKFSLLAGVLVSLALISNIAQAHPPGHRGWRGGGVGVYIGGPYPFYAPPPAFAYSYGYPYAYPYAYSPPQVIVTQPPQPQVYIEQGNGNVAQPSQSTPAQTAPSAENSQGYWYYCEQSDSYYPYVKECPAGWKQVTPTPPSTPAR
ncbi:MAG TPA: hypothetical protein VK958_05305 [Methylophilus sp.]|uniref:hypothetical protein n=1 Tax=Methylophilus sp. TaxID=29541 RepID=UPI002CB64ACD|nr:hypothetical protein [Methylophilus sp.]HSH86652.1 hypothetical protein [Methylophilus sp.]